MAEQAGGYIEILDPQGQSTQVQLEGGHLVIGRTAEADITLDSGTVSRQHAELFSDPFGRWWVRDLKSRNGTLVNSQAIDEHLLQRGDVIEIEGFRLTIAGGTSFGLRPRTHSGTGTGAGLTLADDRSTVRSVHEMAPRIAGDHIRELTAFGSRLLQNDDETQRLGMLCTLMVQREFHGNAAMVIRVSLDPQSAIDPEVLCGPESSTNWRGNETPYVSKTLLRNVRERREPLVASNAQSNSGGIEISLAGTVQEMAAIACPIGGDDQVMDLLYVTFPAEYSTEDWLALAALAAEQYQQAEAAWADRRRAEEQALIEQDLEHARRIQMRLIPQAVQVGGLDVAIGFDPCRWVGGDYVDVLPADDGRVLILVADVCGKGLPAALITATLHAVTRSKGPSTRSIGEFMGLLNHYLCETLPDESFVTAVGMMIDPRTGAFETVNAGHPPAYILTPQAEVRELETGENLPLGYLEMDMSDQHAQLAHGEVIAMYTDGLSELNNEASQMLGVEGVSAVLRQAASPRFNGLADLAARFKERLDEYQGSAVQEDDHTFLLTRLTDPHSTA